MQKQMWEEGGRGFFDFKRGLGKERDGQTPPSAHPLYTKAAGKGCRDFFDFKRGLGEGRGTDTSFC